MTSRSNYMPMVSVQRILDELRNIETHLGRSRGSGEHQIRTFKDYAVGYWAYHCGESKCVRGNNVNSLKTEFDTFFGRLGETALFTSWCRSLPSLVFGCRDPVLNRWYDAFKCVADYSSSRRPPWDLGSPFSDTSLVIGSGEGTSAVISPLLVACIFNLAAVVEPKLHLPETRALRSVSGMTLFTSRLKIRARKPGQDTSGNGLPCLRTRHGSQDGASSGGCGRQ